MSDEVKKGMKYALGYFIFQSIVFTVVVATIMFVFSR